MTVGTGATEDEEEEEELCFNISGLTIILTVEDATCMRMCVEVCTEECQIIVMNDDVGVEEER